MNVMKLADDTAVERIRQNYLNGYELSEHDTYVRTRWEAAHALFLEGNESDTNIAKIMSKRFNISLRCAYLDITNSRNFFGDVRRASKEGYRYAVTQWATELYKKASTKHDFYAMAQALERITKVLNLDKEDQDLPDPSKIQPPVQLLSINFNFLDSPRFEMIDESAQQALIDMYENVMTQIVNTPMKDYLDVFQVKNERVKKFKLPDDNS